MTDAGLLIIGIVLAAVGGELFVRGAVGLAATLRVPPGIIGATVAAFATSSPELAVGVNAALAGTPTVSAGDVLGSNVANIALVLGAMFVFGAVRVDRRDVRRDLPLTIGAPLTLALLIWDGHLSRIDAGILITAFLAWLAQTVMQAWRERDHTAEVLGTTPGRAVWLSLAGVTLLIIAGRLVVTAAEGIGHAFGLDPFVVGATMVAFGTSVPELATVIMARVRGMDELGVGTVLGSNVFNTLWIVGVVGMIAPFDMALDEVHVAVIAGTLGALLLIPGRTWTLGPVRGVLLLLLYFGYTAIIVQTGAA
ncbi:MAG: calcium/sodium antiporter [Dehalococcoidia bacterium]